MNNKYIKIILPENDLDTFNKIKFFLEGTLNFKSSKENESNCEMITFFHQNSVCEKSINQLTNREIEILMLMTKGLKNKAIAKTLFLSEKTIKNNITDIFKKLNVDNRTNAILYALKNDLDIIK